MNPEGIVSKYKFSKHIAYILGILTVALVLLNLRDVALVSWPVIILFLFTLIFNGGLGGKSIVARLPFYLAVIGFVLFLLFISFSVM